MTATCSLASVTLANGLYEITEALADNPVRGRYLGRVTAGADAGATVLIATSNEQVVSIAELAEVLVGDVPGIAELLYIGPLAPSFELQTGIGMVERKPEGASLHELSLPLPVREIARVGAQAAEICARAHADGAILPTLRPEVVFARADQGGLAVTGVAPRCEHFHWTARTVYSGAAAVPPFEHLVAAPETAAMKHSQRSDVYALAATLGVLATGRYPYTEPGWMLQAHAALSRQPPGWALPPALHETLETALAYEPEVRPTMAELHARLASLAEFPT